MMTEDRVIEAFYCLGHWLLEHGRPRDAVHVFRTMLARAPGDERSWLGLGRCHELVEQENVAVELYALGTGTAISSFRCPLAHARLLRSRGNEDDADMSFDLAENRALLQDESTIAMAIAAERRAS